MNKWNFNNNNNQSKINLQKMINKSNLLKHNTKTGIKFIYKKILIF